MPDEVTTGGPPRARPELPPEFRIVVLILAALVALLLFVPLLLGTAVGLSLLLPALSRARRRPVPPPARPRR